MVFIALKSSSYPRDLKLIVRVLAAYLLVSFTVRPLLYLSGEATGQRSAITDVRTSGDYGSFVRIYSVLILGSFTLGLVIHLLCKSQVMQKSELLINSRRSINFCDLSILGSISGILAIVIEQSEFQNPISKSVISVGVVTFCMFIWRRGDYDYSVFRKFFLFSIFFLYLATLYVFTDLTKGPLFGPIIFLLATSNFWQGKANKFTKYAVGCLLIILGVAIFQFLQSRYLGEGYVSEYNSRVDSFPWYLSWLYTIAIRFDIFKATTDAVLAGSGTLGGVNELISMLLSALNWNPDSGRTESSYGQIWNQLVTSKSFFGANESSVSLATGFTADGWIWGGALGVIIFSALHGLIIKYVASMMSAGIFVSTVAFGLITTNNFYETGLVGFFSLLSSSIKTSLFILILSIAVSNNFAKKSKQK